MTGIGSLVPAPDNQRQVTWPGGTREDSRNWMSYGACHGADTELFFPVATAGRALKQIDSAKAVCGRCTVRADCLSYALETMQHGIWGGTTEDERAAMRRHQPPRAQPDGSKGSRTPRPPRAGYLRSVVHVAPATRDWTGRSWLAGYQRALDQIEKMLLTDDYRLPSLVAFFIRLARNDVMPGTERVQTWPGSSL